MLLLFLLAEEIASGPVPIDPGHSISFADYPEKALRRLAEGIVGVDLAIASDGTVSECTIGHSSGDVDLDQVTCKLVSARTRFTPARSAANVAIPSHFKAGIQWLIPSLPKAPMGPSGPWQTRTDYPVEALRKGWEGTTEFRYVVNEQGRIETCKVVKSSGHAVLDEAACHNFSVQARFSPALRDDGSPTFALFSGATAWKIPR